MFCENCGNKISGNDKFCIKCGHPAVPISSDYNHRHHSLEILDSNRWYVRLLKVFYIILYIPLPFVVYGVWTSNDPYYSTYYSYGSYEEAFWYSLMTFGIWVIVLRLMKIAVKYIVVGQKPNWLKEFKKIY
jgi:hypothetical protein